MTANDAETTIYDVEREIDNLSTLLKTIIRTIEDLDKDDIGGLLEVAQRQCAVLKPALEPASVFLRQLRISEMKGRVHEDHPQTH